MAERRRGIALFMLAAFAAVAAVWPSSSEAAVRRCELPVTSGPQEAATEAEARRAAMARWLIAAGRYSPGHASWRLAVRRSIVCAPVDGQRFRCEATATPCIIQQVPEPDLKRVPPAQPGAPLPAPAPRRSIQA